jgi:hypothetical protein
VLCEPQNPGARQEQRDRAVDGKTQDQAGRPAGAGVRAHELVIGVAIGSLKLGSWIAPPGT